MNNSSSDNILSQSEIKDLIYNPNSPKSKDSTASDLENLEKFKKVENPKFPFFSRSIPKLFIVGILACPLFLFALYFTSGFVSSTKTAAQTISDASDEQLEKENESLQQQLDDLQVQNAILIQDFEELQAKKDKVKVIKTKPQPVEIAKAEVKPEPLAQKPFESIKPTPQPEIEPVNPYDEWNRYATLGVIDGDGFTESEKELEPFAVSSDKTANSPKEQEENPQILARTETSDSIPIATLGHTDPTVASSKSSRVESFSQKDDGQGTGDFLSQEARNALFPETSYGNSFLEAKRREYAQLDAANSNSEPEQSTETFLEKKRREYAQLDAANLNSAQQSREYQAQSPVPHSTKNIKLGSQITGELSQSISWVDGEQPQLRGVINLSEDLLADDNSIALPANSSIIVEVDPERNGVINLQAIAISYENDRGQLIQESISPDIFVIQDQDGSPITYNNRASNGEIPGQDLVTDLITRQSRTARRVIREVENINEQNNSRPETFELKQGTELTITVNSFLKIRN